MAEFSDWMFVMGLAAGGLLGAAVVIWFTERRMEEEVQTWEHIMAEQQGHIAELRAHTPRAVTKLTNRERTVEL